MTYFKDVPDTLSGNGLSVPVVGFEDPKIQPNDVLQVSVQTLDPATSALMGVSTAANATVGGGSVATGSAANIPAGYQVDRNGTIELPLLGKIKVGGMTTSEATDAIRKKVLVNYKDPVVNVRFANFEINVIGEVVRPGKYIIANEKASILDAIGLAGDLTIYGIRTNVLLVRDDGKQKKMVRFDLTSSTLYQSPYYFLRQGDLIYVEATRGKVLASEAGRTRTLSILISAASLLVVILTRVQF